MDFKNKSLELFVDDINAVEDVDTGIITVSGYANKYKNEDGSIVVDRSTESVLPSGYDLVNFKKNPVLLYQHDRNTPIGKIITIELRPDGLYIEANIHKVLHNKAYYAVQHGILAAFSIGFVVKDYKELDGVYYWTEVELLEVSVVSVPDNQDSIFNILTNSPCNNGKCVLASKAVKLPNKKDIKELSWANTDKTEMMEATKAFGNEIHTKDMYLMVKDLDDETTWKFPHHAYDKSTNMVGLSKEGLDSAISALKSAQDLDKYSLEEKKDAADHLLKHYSELLVTGFVDNIPDDLNELIKYFEEKDVDTNPDAESIPEQPESDSTINTPDEPEEGGNNPQEPENGESSNEPDGDKVTTLEDVTEFISEASKSSEGLATLFDLYANLELSINEALPKLLEEEEN